VLTINQQIRSTEPATRKTETLSYRVITEDHLPRQWRHLGIKHYCRVPDVENTTFVVVKYHHHQHWLDSPMWALAFLRSFCQLSFSIAKFLQFFTPKVRSPSHLSLGLPVVLIPIRWVFNTFLVFKYNHTKIKM
jgi:hypothetical protein